MWKKFVTPEVLFLLGTIQALSPYILWYFLGSNTSYNYEITYLPVIIWTVGYAFFWLGAKFVKADPISPIQSLISLSSGSAKIAIWATISLVVVQIIQAIQIYGVLPIYGYITGASNVTEINELQRDSG